MKNILTLVLTVLFVVSGGLLIFEINKRIATGKQVKKALTDLKFDTAYKLKTIEAECDENLKRHRIEMDKIDKDAEEENKQLDDFLLKESPHPVLDELKRRYGDVRIYSGGVVRVDSHYWKSFTLAGETCVFEFTDFDLSDVKGCPTVEFYDEYGLMTGRVRYSMSGERLVSAALGVVAKNAKNVSAVRAKTASANCRLYIGEVKYYRTSFTKLEN